MLFIGGVVVVALFAALIAPMFVDWTDFRTDFEREASRIVGKPVVVHGSVDARLIPFPSVTLNDVRVGEATDGEPLVQVAHFSMDAELAPFLSGEALIFDMRLEEPKARIKLLADGTLDWARGRSASIPAKNVVLENVTVSGGEIEFIDDQTGRTRNITDLNAMLSAKSLVGPWKIDGRGAIDGEAGSFGFASQPVGDDGSLSLRTRIVPDARPFGVELEGQLAIVDLKPQYKGTFRLVKNEQKDEAATDGEADDAAAIRATGGFELNNERIRVPEYRVELGPVADPYVVTGEATLDTGKAPEFLLIADGQQIDVSRIGNSNNGTTAKTGRDPAISLRQRLASLVAIAADIPIPQVPGRASLMLPALLVGDTTVRDIRLDLRPDGLGWIVDNAVAQLPGRTQLEAKGRLNLKGELGFAGDLLLASNQPSGFASWLAGSVDPAIRKLKTAGFSAKVNLTETLQRFENLEVAAGPASLSGRIERESPADGQPALSMVLKGNSIDLEALQALAGLVAGDASAQTLLSHKIAADLSAEHFSAFGEQADGVEAVMSLSDGLLRAERLSIASLGGAAIQLSGTLSGALPKPQAALKMNVEADDMSAVMALVGRHLPVHPLLERLAASGRYYSGANLDFTLDSGASGGEGPLTLGVIGQANGSRITAHYQAEDFDQAWNGGGVEAEATIANPATTVLLGQAGFDPLPFDADTDGILALKFVSDADAKAKGSLTFTTDRTSLTARGDVDLAAASFLNGAMKLSLDSQDFEPYLLMQGLGLPQMGSGLPLSIVAEATVTADAVALSAITGKVDRNGFSGEVTLDRKDWLKKATADLSFDTIDLPLIAEAVLGPVQNLETGDLQSVKVQPSLAQGLDVSADLSAKQFFPGIGGAVSEFKGKTRWTGDEFEISSLSGNVFGGTAEGRILIGNGSGSGFFQTRLTVKDGDLSRVSWESGQGVPVVSGSFGLDLAMEASGASVAAMAETASGSGTMTLDDLSIRGLNTTALKGLMTSADALKGEIAAATVKPLVEQTLYLGEAKLGAASIPFNIAGGKVRAQNVTAADDAAALTGEAEIDLLSQTVDGNVSVLFKAGNEAQAGAEPAVRLSFAGQLATPGETLDVTEFANFLSLRAFERERRRVETLQANVLEKQRLRREVALYKFNATEREAERLRAEEEARKRKLAAEEAARQKAKADAELAAKAEAERLAKDDADRKAKEEAAVKAAEQAAKTAAEAERKAKRALEAQKAKAAEDGKLPVNPSESVTKGEDLPPVDGKIDGSELNFETLPGVETTP
ncbi:AsmA family protein [Pararhizobium sp.]|uniref:AsmA family protein n=1 Tax=Pararhizobium sp. TaxID=1977563 RepID=UPI003FA79317